MRAEPARQLRLLDLQAIDTRLQQIAHARKNIPQLAELADLQAKAVLIDDQVIRSRTALDDVLQHGAQPQVTIAGIPAAEPALRTGLERAYRELASRTSDRDERVRLVDEANAVRAWSVTWPR